MQPVRRKRLDQQPGLVDQFAEWLIHRIPLTTLVLLSLVVVASEVTFDHPAIFVAAAAIGDVIVNVSRPRRRLSQEAESGRFAVRAAA
jgi:hypothetical protein